MYHLGNMIASSLVHGAVYGVIYQLMRHLGLGGSVVLGVVLIGAASAFMRKRGPRWTRY